MRRKKSAGAVVFNRKNGKYLLLHYPAGHWDFPKGHIEKGESEINAAKREVFEETGLKIDTLFGFREVIKYYFKEHGVLIEKMVVYFLGITEEDKVKLSYEHDGYEWLSYEDALQRITYNTSKKVLIKAHLFLKNLGYSS